MLTWKSSTFEVLPAMTYLVEITGWKRDRNKNSNNENIRFDAKVVKPVAHKDKHLSDFITITENSIWRLEAFLLACLNKPADMPQLDTNSSEFENILNACKGRQMFWNVIVDNYNGKDNNKTSQKEPYSELSKQAPFNAESINDIPDWVKNQEPPMPTEEA